MIYLKNLTKMAFLTSVVISLSACNGGGGGSSGGSNPTPTPTTTPSPTPSQWTQVGVAPDLFSDNLMYDGATNQLFMGIGASGNTLCSISANATSTDDWDCSIRPPQNLYKATNYTTDGNGHIYILGELFLSNDWNIYTYSTQTKTWNTQLMNNDITDYDGWYYSNGSLYYANNQLYARTVNLSTGDVGYYTPLNPNGSSDLHKTTALNGIVYYQGILASMIYSRDIQSSQTSAQFGKPSGSISSITGMEQNIYICGGGDSGGFVSYLPVGSNASAEWNKLPPVYSEVLPPNVLFQPGCLFMTSGNGYLFVYNLVRYPEIDQVKAVVMKYKI